MRDVAHSACFWGDSFRGANRGVPQRSSFSGRGVPPKFRPPRGRALDAKPLVDPVAILFSGASSSPKRRFRGAVASRPTRLNRDWCRGRRPSTPPPRSVVVFSSCLRFLPKNFSAFSTIEYLVMGGYISEYLVCLVVSFSLSFSFLIVSTKSLAWVIVFFE